MDAAVTVVCGAVGVWLLFSCYLQLLGVDVAETKLRTMLLPCYLQLLGVDVGERDCGDESADDAVTLLFCSCWG